MRAADGLNTEAGTTPWHLKAHFESESADRSTSHTGTYEEWWSLPRGSKIIWTVDGKTTTFYRDSSGSSVEGDEPPLALQLFIPAVFTAPLPFAPTTPKLAATEIEFGAIKLPCIRAGEGPALSPLARVICSDQQLPVVRWVRTSGLQETFNDVIRLDGRYVARKVEISGERSRALLVEIDLLESFTTQPPGFFSPTAGAVKKITDSLSTFSPPKPLHLVPPLYPETAKAQRLQGTVTVAVIIGTDGVIHQIDPIASPAAMLTSAATLAMRGWKYQPALIDQKPVETLTILTCIFTLGVR